MVLVSATPAFSAEVVQLDPQNWDAYAPAGKEVDSIYGDYVLRSDRIIAVIGEPVDGRKANMTVKNVGGAVIDLTRRDVQSDQLSCYYPHNGTYKLTGPVEWPKQWKQSANAARLAFEVDSTPPSADESMETIIGYELVDGQDHLSVKTLLINRGNSEQVVKLVDGIRADGEFEFGHDSASNLVWCYDRYWRGAYGLTSQAATLRQEKSDNARRPLAVEYAVDNDEAGIVVPASGEVTLIRALIPAADTLQLASIARTLQGAQWADVGLTVKDENGPVANAYLEVKQGDLTIGKTRFDGDGRLLAKLPVGEFELLVTEQARKDLAAKAKIVASINDLELNFDSPAPGYVEGSVVDQAGQGIPCKIAFRGQGVSDPDFGPDSAIHGVRNLWYTADGDFRVQLQPGSYEVLISRGFEYDAVLTTVEVQSSETTRVEKQLIRSVDTAGWISAELHSHSTPSGDNTSHQRGRVLNLLAEHIEFIPCTEHQRISTYQPHLEHFNAVNRVLTCPGMELTGKPLPINHQNTFPLIEHAHTQDGGGPQIHTNPTLQIARLAMWDDNSDKVVQINHPNIAQMVGDADGDGQPDEGFRKMFHFADVIEVHPPEMIFDELAVNEEGYKGRGTVILNWMQLLNLGYRLPGVVNTDAHWNFHGSGWLRNYVRSSTDEPAQADLMDICHALEKGQVVISNGPFLEVAASAAGQKAGPGEDLALSGTSVDLHICVQCPNWLDVNRVQVFVNGRADQRWNFTRRQHPRMFQHGVKKFKQVIQVSLANDAHLIVATGGKGLQLGHVYGPDAGKVMPVAVSNPIFVDVDGGGFQANGDMLGRPLPVEPGHQPTHGHNHTPSRTSATATQAN
jgi:hypothetical protein